MSQLTRHPAYLMIEDTLDAVGQKYRAVLIVRGMALWGACALAATFLAAAVAHWAGPGRLSLACAIVWATWLTVSGAIWVVRPLLLRPRSVEVARLVESRVDGLHNGLTNGVLLARATDLHASPWIGPILDEILLSARSAPLGQAVRMADLRPLLLRLALLVVPLLALLAVPSVRSGLEQGFRQMFSPAAFVPRLGKVQILEVQPREATLVRGAALEITALAEDPDGGAPAALLVFEDDALPNAQLPAAPSEDGKLRYAYRVDHVEHPLRFRVEVGDTQSPWCTVHVVRQVKWEELTLTVTPPNYTGKPSQSLTLKPGDLEKTSIAVPEGSRVDLTVLADVAVRNALLQLDQGAEQHPMEVRQDGRRFAASLFVMRDLELAALPTEGGQVLARLPDPPLRLACTRDAPPAIEMRWPTQNGPAAPAAELKVHALVRDDHGLSAVRILMGVGAEGPLAVVHEAPVAGRGPSVEVSHVLNIPANLRVHGQVLRVQVEAQDNRNLSSLVNAGIGAPASANDTGPQTVSSNVYEITFRDPEQIARERKEETDRLRQILMDLLKKQQDLHTLAVAWKPSPATAAATMPRIRAGQAELRAAMLATSTDFPFSPDDRIVQKVLAALAVGHARDAEETALAIATEPVEAEKVKLNRQLQTSQRRIVEALEALLSKLAPRSTPSTQPVKAGGDLDAEREAFKELDEALKKFLAEEKRILEATAHLAKKPVDAFDADDKKLLDELTRAQEKLDAFMQEKISDFSKLAEQDMANAALLKELMEVYSEVTMARDALKKKAIELAIPVEEMGVELAKEISSNLEKWLMDHPEREKWNQEDPLGRTDVPMPELPAELEDMVGELMEEQEDLFEEMEDTAANWADSLDKGAGWDAADGPIANMSAKGVTGNQLPNNNEMNGRSGEGRSGKSSGEMVEETATGKGGRNTPTRLDPTPFQQGQVNDQSKDPTGGATGGGKISGQGGAGLEGPVPPRDLRDRMDRLAGKQAELRNKAERLALERKLGSYDNFRLLQAAAMMRRVEADVRAHRYVNALRRRDVLLDTMDTSRLLLGGQVHVQRDTSPSAADRMEDEIGDVANGELPEAWKEALREYYRKLGQR